MNIIKQIKYKRLKPYELYLINLINENNFDDLNLRYDSNTKTLYVPWGRFHGEILLSYNLSLTESENVIKDILSKYLDIEIDIVKGFITP